LENIFFIIASYLNLFWIYYTSLRFCIIGYFIFSLLTLKYVNQPKLTHNSIFDIIIIYPQGSAFLTFYNITKNPKSFTTLYFLIWSVFYIIQIFILSSNIPVCAVFVIFKLLSIIYLKVQRPERGLYKLVFWPYYDRQKRICFINNSLIHNPNTTGDILTSGLKKIAKEVKKSDQSKVIELKHHISKIKSLKKPLNIKSGLTKAGYGRTHFCIQWGIDEKINQLLLATHSKTVESKQFGYQINKEWGQYFVPQLIYETQDPIITPFNSKIENPGFEYYKQHQEALALYSTLNIKNNFSSSNTQEVLIWDMNSRNYLIETSSDEYFKFINNIINTVNVEFGNPIGDVVQSWKGSFNSGLSLVNLLTGSGLQTTDTGLEFSSTNPEQRELYNFIIKNIASETIFTDYFSN